MGIIKKNYFTIFKIIPIFLFFVACSSSDKATETKKISDINMYKNGLVFLENSDYDKALIEFESLFLNYPFSSLAIKAEIMSAYSLYQKNEIDKAINKLKFFIEINPKGNLSEYAQYLLAMCYYIQISNKGRDSSINKKALNYFKIIVTKYPNSKYAKDAKIKIEYIRNTLATNELMIGNFYLKRKAPTSSIKRFKLILKEYQNTSVIPETLFRLNEALLMLGLKEEAIKSNAILNYNFPKNEWAMLSKKLLKINSKIEKNYGLTSRISNYIKTIFD